MATRKSLIQNNQHDNEIRQCNGCNEKLLIIKEFLNCFNSLVLIAPSIKWKSFIHNHQSPFQPPNILWVVYHKRDSSVGFILRGIPRVFCDVESFWIFGNLWASFFKATERLTCGNVTEKIKQTGLLETLCSSLNGSMPNQGMED